MITWQLKAFNELTSEDLYLIMRLRGEVFIVEQNCPYLDADGKDRDSWHLSGSIANDLVAYARIVFPGISYDEVSIGRVVTSPKYRGKEYGKLLMKESVEVIEKLYGKVPIRISAQEYLKKFYEDFGFVVEGDAYLEDFIRHIAMLRKGS